MYANGRAVVSEIRLVLVVDGFEPLKID